MSNSLILSSLLNLGGSFLYKEGGEGKEGEGKVKYKSGGILFDAFKTALHAYP
jgi:hypothetical protein